ncbi:MAG: MFS transporter, partial [Patescibacteria group bacterium]
MNAFTATLKRLSPLKNFNEFFISWVYFVQGSGSIVGIAEAVILREQLGLDFYQMGLIGAASIIPWSIKPLYGLLTDLVPIGKFRRRPYLHFAPLIAVIGYAWIAIMGHDFISFLIPLVIANVGLGLTDTATDGFIVEQSNLKNVTRLQGITQASIRVAAFFATFFSGLLIYRNLLTPHQIFFIAALLPLGTFVLSFFIREKPVSREDENVARHELTPAFVLSLIAIFILIIGNLAFPNLLPDLTGLPRTIWGVVTWGGFFAWIATYFMKLKKLKLASGTIFVAMLFILLWRFNPGAGSPMFFYLKNDLGLGAETIGFINTASHIASIIAVILAVKVFDRFNLKRLLGYTVLAAGIFGFSSFAITRVTLAESVGGFWLTDLFATLIALPVYFFEAVISLISGEGGKAFWENAIALSPLENFLFVQSF